MAIKEARIYDVKKMPDQSVYGLRVLTMRKWPQGFSRKHVDVWLPDAGPSVELLSAYRNNPLSWSWAQFAKNYEYEQKHQQTCRIVRYVNGERVSDEPVSRSPLNVLRELEEAFGTVTVMCWEDTKDQDVKMCHRHLLVAMCEKVERVMVVTQLSWFDDVQAEPEKPVSSPLEHIRQDAASLSEQDMRSMRSWLLDWGKAHQYPAFSFPFDHRVYSDPTLEDRRFGLIGGTKQDWEADATTPHTQRELYAGEWLVKCIEHVQRFDRRELRIPEQVSRMSIENRDGWDGD